MAEIDQDSLEFVPGLIFNCETSKVTTQHDPDVRDSQARAKLEAERRAKPRTDARKALIRLAASSELEKDDIVAVLDHLLGAE
jgi:hypothetical protein